MGWSWEMGWQREMSGEGRHDKGVERATQRRRGRCLRGAVVGSVAPRQAVGTWCHWCQLCFADGEVRYSRCRSPFVVDGVAGIVSIGIIVVVCRHSCALTSDPKVERCSMASRLRRMARLGEMEGGGRGGNEDGVASAVRDSGFNIHAAHAMIIITRADHHTCATRLLAAMVRRHACSRGTRRYRSGRWAAPMRTMQASVTARTVAERELGGGDGGCWGE